jgi:DNA polymerase
MQREEQMAALQQRCQGCQKCALGDHRTHLVFGDGNPNTGLVFIGEGPGEQEDQQGIPFVGRGGQLLDQMLDLIGLDRSRYYICNIVKCRPPQNRDPMNIEQEACSAWLNEQLRLLQPKIVVCLGRIAACRIINPDYKITRSHGQWEQRNGVWMTALYHPAALLRDVSKRPETFDDLKAIQSKVREVCPDLLPR